MTALTIERGPFTERMLAELKSLGLPVGDNAAPEDPHGWQGEPNADGSSFIPYCMVAAGASRAGTGSLGQSASEWVLPYTVTYAGVSRDMTDWMADKMRVQLCNITRDKVAEGFNWRIQQIRCTSVGGSNRIGSTFPDYFTQADLFEVWTSKERS